NMLDRGAQRRLKIGKEWRISQAELMRFVAGSVTPTHSPPSPTPSKGPVPLVESRWLLAVYVEVLSDSTEIVGK
ncbi:MAG: hypothetical protein NZP34_12445, partial [Caldilineales bacterium]|nr:hypothetical protein [Caldilineales bacterium]